nr:hypothetical protein [Tanacetum cinerariifolium]
MDAVVSGVVVLTPDVPLIANVITYLGDDIRPPPLLICSLVLPPSLPVCPPVLPLRDFIPMGSKEEDERIKRKGLSLEQESAKKQKISEEVTEEAKSFDEVPKEKVYHEGKRSYWKITREGLPSKAGSSTCDDQLQALSRDLLTDGE